MHNHLSVLSPVPPSPIPPPAPPAAPAEFEFDIGQNEVIAELGASMRFVAIASMIFGAIYGAVGVYNGASLGGILVMMQGFLMFIVGVWLAGGARAFRAVVSTEGSDIAHTMTALGKLRSVYRLQAVLYGIAIAFVALAFTFALTARG